MADLKYFSKNVQFLIQPHWRRDSRFFSISPPRTLYGYHQGFFLTTDINGHIVVKNLKCSKWEVGNLLTFFNLKSWNHVMTSSLETETNFFGLSGMKYPYSTVVPYCSTLKFFCPEKFLTEIYFFASQPFILYFTKIVFFIFRPSLRSIIFVKIFVGSIK